MDLESAFDIRFITLEPRLEEYIRVAKFNRENDIIPDIDEKTQFCITPNDIKMIKRYQKNKKSLYSPKHLGENSDHYVEQEHSSFENEMNDFKKDPRYQRTIKKAESHRKAISAIRNFKEVDTMDPDYFLYNGSNPYDYKKYDKPQPLNKPYDDPGNYINNQLDFGDLETDDNFGIMMNSRDFVLGPSRETNKKGSKFQQQFQQQQKNPYCYNPDTPSRNSSKNPSSYNHPPQISYNNTLNPIFVNGGIDTMNKGNYNIDPMLNKMDRYNKHLNDTYDYVGGFADDTHNYTSETRTGTKRENANNYKPVPFQYGSGFMDVNNECYLREGIKDVKKKSYGYRNNFEHNFSYISPDIYDPNHTVQMWPTNTRGQQKEIARPHSAAMRDDRQIRKSKKNIISMTPDD